MNDAEAAQILQLISAAWPKQQLPNETRALYGVMLADFSYQETYDAINTLICTAVFVPSIAEIRRIVVETRCNLLEPQRAWMLVCRRYGCARGCGDRQVEL